MKNLDKKIVVRGQKVQLPTKYGHFELIPFQEKSNKLEHIVLVKGDLKSNGAFLTRVHSACATGDLFGSLRCDCGEQLIQSMKNIEKNGSGILVYLQQEGRGIGLMNKIEAYHLQEQGLDTVDANIALGFAPDERKYAICAEILKILGVDKIKLMTNNPDKITGLEENGIEITERIPLVIVKNEFNSNYLETKEKRMQHVFGY
jgi:3,4-dihydroxy 2-butanone 4-phosphate synthase/GTP cyclohydrolase II